MLQSYGKSRGVIMILNYQEVIKQYQPALLTRAEVQEFITKMKQSGNSLNLHSSKKQNQTKANIKFGLYQVLIDIIANKNILENICNFIYKQNFKYNDAVGGKKIVLDIMEFIIKACDNQLFKEDVLKIRTNLIIFVKENKVE